MNILDFSTGSTYNMAFGNNQTNRWMRSNAK